jgi:hypothetical protein
MNSENIKKITNQAIEQLITALNEGRSETLAQYIAAIGRFHCYSFRNVMLIASQRAVTYCYTSLESMNIGGCASLETRDGRHVAVRTNLMDLVDRKQITRD